MEHLASNSSTIAAYTARSKRPPIEYETAYLVEPDGH